MDQDRDESQIFNKERGKETERQNEARLVREVKSDRYES